MNAADLIAVLSGLPPHLQVVDEAGTRVVIEARATHFACGTNAVQLLMEPWVQGCVFETPDGKRVEQ